MSKPDFVFGNWSINMGNSPADDQELEQILMEHGAYASNGHAYGSYEPHELRADILAWHQRQVEAELAGLVDKPHPEYANPHDAAYYLALKRLAQLKEARESEN